MKEPHPHDLITPKAPSPNTNALRVRSSTYELGVKEGDINIWSIIICIVYYVFFSAEVVLMCLLKNKLPFQQPH